MVLQALLLDQLLSGEITSCKEHRSRHALGEQRTGCEPSIVPELQICQNQQKVTRSPPISSVVAKTYHLMNADMVEKRKNHNLSPLVKKKRPNCKD